MVINETMERINLVPGFNLLLINTETKKKARVIPIMNTHSVNTIVIKFRVLKVTSFFSFS